MYQAATALKQRGAKVFLTSPGALPDGYQDNGLCPNCGGVGTLYLEYVTGGPFDTVPNHRTGTDDNGKKIGPNEHPAWHDGKWYRMTMTGFPCVVCQGGTQAARFEQPAEIAL